MNENLTLSVAGANLVKAFEGCLRKAGHDQIKAYVCPAGVVTIGWGTTTEHGHKITKDMVWTQRQCDEAFLADMKAFEASVKRLVKVELNQHQFDALVSFCYNCGAGNLEKSTLLRKVNAKDFAGAANEFHKWNKGGGKVLPGLIRRRASESLLFRGIPDLDYDGKPDKVVPHEPANEMPQAVDRPADA
jgi:lysozyme